MTGIAQFLESILSFLGSVIALVWNFIGGTAQLLVMIPRALSFLNYSLANLPTVLIAFAMGLISISVAYLIIGR